ncbi:hypothetical protein Tco_0056140 [Tanacetum coccineum]
MTKIPFITLIILTFITTTTSSTLLKAAHTVLTEHGFPVGLLPSSVHSHTLNLTSGEFSVDLGSPCKLILPPDNYLATYSNRVSGKIVGSSIVGLKGIKVKALFQWWGITGIKVSGENLVFEVGSLSAKYPSKNFDEVPVCVGRKKHDSS